VIKIENFPLGDNPAADIRGAVKAGGKFQSVLVR
jgi:ribonucleotide monophosphatase NagD (HAD superfamily)